MNFLAWSLHEIWKHAFKISASSLQKIQNWGCIIINYSLITLRTKVANVERCASSSVLIIYLKFTDFPEDDVKSMPCSDMATRAKDSIEILITFMSESFCPSDTFVIKQTLNLRKGWGPKVTLDILFRILNEHSVQVWWKK